MAHVLLDDKLHRRVKIYAAHNGLTIKEFMEKSVLRALDENANDTSMIPNNSKQKRKSQRTAAVA